MKVAITDLEPGDVFVLDGSEHECIEVGWRADLLGMVPVRMRRFGGLAERLRHLHRDTTVELRS